MKRANLIATACATVVIAAGTLMTARAQDSGAAAIEKSILTFSGPVELPNLTLQAGTYVFKRPDANTARVIQVFSEDEKNILGQFLTVPSKRLEVTSENVVTFKEKKEGTTAAVHYWYYPGRETGHEFVYPKDQAMRIAARTGEKVMSTDSTDLNASAKIDTIEGSGLPAAPAAEVKAEAKIEAPAPVAETQIAANTPMPRETVGTAGQSNAPATDRNELPATASPVPLVAMMGLLSLGAFAALRLRRL